MGLQSSWCSVAVTVARCWVSGDAWFSIWLKYVCMYVPHGELVSLNKDIWFCIVRTLIFQCATCWCWRLHMWCLCVRLFTSFDLAPSFLRCCLVIRSLRYSSCSSTGSFPPYQVPVSGTSFSWYPPSVHRETWGRPVERFHLLPHRAHLRQEERGETY